MAQVGRRGRGVVLYSLWEPG